MRAFDPREAPLQERLKTAGSLAEGTFERWADRLGVRRIRFGLDRPPFKAVAFLPEHIRLMPDYLCEYDDRHAFYEVKGTGRDKLVKVRWDSLDAMGWWAETLPVFVFVFDASGQGRVTHLPHAALRERCAGTEVGTFNDGRNYYKVPHDRFDWERAPS